MKQKPQTTIEACQELHDAFTELGRVILEESRLGIVIEFFLWKLSKILGEVSHGEKAFPSASTDPDIISLGEK